MSEVRHTGSVDTLTLIGHVLQARYWMDIELAQKAVRSQDTHRKRGAAILVTALVLFLCSVALTVTYFKLTERIELLQVSIYLLSRCTPLLINLIIIAVSSSLMIIPLLWLLSFTSLL